MQKNEVIGINGGTIDLTAIASTYARVFQEVYPQHRSFSVYYLSLIHGRLLHDYLMYTPSYVNELHIGQQQELIEMCRQALLHAKILRD